MTFEPAITDFLSCPHCQRKLFLKEGNLVCSFCREKYPLINPRLVVFGKVKKENKTSFKSWQKFYRDKIYTKNDESVYLKQHEKVIEDICRQKDLRRKVFLEIGCGPMFMGRYFASSCRLVIGIDFSLAALSFAQKAFEEKNLRNYLLIQADLNTIPLAPERVDFIYGGGVIEHFPKTEIILKQIYRLLKNKGVSFNSVPVLNLGTIYRQAWGNIPDFPILRPLAEFLHFRLLKGRYARFGYELSFLPSSLVRLHRKVGFKKVYYKKLEIESAFDYLPNFFKPLARVLACYCPFWPMIEVIAQK